jgi:signal transduction histidine kinase
MPQRANETGIDKTYDLDRKWSCDPSYPGLVLSASRAPISGQFVSQVSIKVLVIEDDPGDVDFLKELLAEVEGETFDLVCVDRLASGVACLDEEEFDVVLLDLSLPDSQGLDTFSKVHMHAPNVPIIVLTGLDDEEVAILAVQGGAQDYLSKAVLDGPLLTRAIRYAIERHRLLLAMTHHTQALAHTNTELVRSNKDLDDYAYIVSHDLKEPLRGIRNYAMMLLEDYADQLDDKGRTRLETLRNLAERLENLINALLHYSRVGQVDLAITVTDLDKLVRDIIDSLALRLEQEKVEIRILTPLPTVRCDTTRIGEVFRNLITNAIKYNDKPQKWIEIGVANHQTEEQVFYVRDNGIGIGEKYYEMIFRIFKRLHGRDQYGGGTGMGLTIVKKIIERHGGRIWVESTPGEGTTFYFTIEENQHGANDAADGHESALAFVEDDLRTSRDR